MSEYLRYCVAKLVYLILGLRVDYWRKRVEEIWSSNDDARNLELENFLSITRPVDGSGAVILSLSDLESAVPVNKITLMERVALDSKPKAFKRHTSGTSGKRTDVFLNKDEISRMLAVRDYCFRYYGVRLGEREARIWGNTKNNYIALLKDSLLNRKSFSLSDKAIKAQVAEIKRWEPKYIYGYSSIIMKLAKYLEKKGDSVDSVELVVCTAEQILTAQKKYLSRVFNANVVEEYGATEFDVIGFEDRDGYLRAVNPWLLLENKDRKLLVSDVSRSSQSFVRYELGDIADLKSKSNGRFGGELFIDSLEGREANRFAFLDYNNTFHASEFSRAMNDYFECHSDIFDFVVVQNDVGSFIIYLSKEPKCGARHFEDSYRKYLKKRIGYELLLTVEFRVNFSEISNKRSYFIQNIKAS